MFLIIKVNDDYEPLIRPCSINPHLKATSQAIFYNRDVRTKLRE